MTPIKVALDCDGVVLDFSRAYAHLLVKVGGDLLTTKYPDWKTNPFFGDTWYWERAAGYSKEIEAEVWNNHILQEGSTFWQTLAPLPGAVDSLMTLNSLVKKGRVEVYFLTTRAGWRVKRQTEECLYKLGMDYPTVLIAKDKMPMLKLLQADFFVDDKLETMNLAASSNLKADIQLYLPDTPYNREGRTGGYHVVNGVKEALQHAGVWEDPAPTSIKQVRRKKVAQ